MSQDKPREFWIYQSIRDHVTEDSRDVVKWKKEFIELELVYPPEIAHVIEYSAFLELRETLKLLWTVCDDTHLTEEVKSAVKEVLAKIK